MRFKNLINVVYLFLKLLHKYLRPLLKQIRLEFIHYDDEPFRWPYDLLQAFFLHHLVRLLWLPLLLLSPLDLITIIMECEKTVLFLPYILITVFVMATREELMMHFIRVGIYKVILAKMNSTLDDCIFLMDFFENDWC